VSKLTELPKRILVGQALRSDRLNETLLPKRIALPVFASDALSSVAYAPQEILLVLSVAGLSFYHYSPWIAGAVVLLMLTVVASYRQNVHAYPSGGGDYEIASVNLGQNAGLTVASALSVDYVLTVAVSVSAGVAATVALVPSTAPYRVPMAVLFIVLIAYGNLRGVKESGRIFAAPTYVFIACILSLIVIGVLRAATGSLAVPQATVTPAAAGLGFLAGVPIFVALHALASGSTAMTGVEAISNGVPAFKPVEWKHARQTLVVLGLLLGSIGLDKLTGVPRFTFGSADLTGGLSFAALAIGLFGLSEILLNLERTETIKAIAPKLRELIPRWKDLRDSAPAPSPTRRTISSSTSSGVRPCARSRSGYARTWTSLR